MTVNRLSFAEALAREAGSLAQALKSEPKGLSVETKGHQDFVTAADYAVEKLIQERIAQSFPGDAILGEETGLTGQSSSVWIIDPIDGTSNYMRGLPDWAISIGFFDGTDLTLGVIYAPDLGLLASAEIGQLAKLNGEVINVSARNDLAESLVILGYSERTGITDHIGRINQLLASGCDYRKQGAATIGFLSVAAGRAEAYYEPTLNIWDAAAGLVIVRSAGGHIEHAPISKFLEGPDEVFASNQNSGEIIRICRSY